MRVRLTDICTPRQWKTISTSELLSEGYPVYGANGIIGYYSGYNHESPVVAITCRGATCGTIKITVPKSYVTGNAMCLDNLRSDVLLEYLYYCLLHFNFKNVISGSAQPQITRQGLEKVSIELHPLDEQRTIIDVLSKLETIILARKEELQKLDELVKARFVEMFGDPFINPMGWNKVLLEDCLESIDNGKSFICESFPRQGDNPAILKLSAATYGVYKPEENKAIINHEDFIESAEVHDGDLLFTRKNTPELVGMSAYVTSTPKGLMMPDLIFRLNTKKCCNKVFLWQLINHSLFRSQIQNLASGSAKSMSNISKERLVKLKIVLPPLELQEQFAAFVNQVDKSKVVELIVKNVLQLLYSG